VFACCITVGHVPEAGDRVREAGLTDVTGRRKTAVARSTAAGVARIAVVGTATRVGRAARARTAARADRAAGVAAATETTVVTSGRMPGTAAAIAEKRTASRPSLRDRTAARIGRMSGKEVPRLPATDPEIGPQAHAPTTLAVVADHRLRTTKVGCC